jgi:hypothetical protein
MADYMHLLVHYKFVMKNPPSFAVSTLVSFPLESNSPNAERFYIPPLFSRLNPKRRWISVGHPFSSSGGCAERKAGVFDTMRVENDLPLDV